MFMCSLCGKQLPQNKNAWADMPAVPPVCWPCFNAEVDALTAAIRNAPDDKLDEVYISGMERIGGPEAGFSAAIDTVQP